MGPRLVRPEFVVEVGVDVAPDTAAGGATPHARTTPAPTSPLLTAPSPSRRLSGVPRLAHNTGECVPIPARARAVHPAPSLTTQLKPGT